jgi:hypothetical protein
VDIRRFLIIWYLMSKYDLRHKARLVAGGNWTVNDKEDIYSGVVRMDSVRIVFSSENHRDFYVVHVTLGMIFCLEKLNKSLYNCWPRVWSKFTWENLIIDKSLYGTKDICCNISRAFS